MHTLTQESGTKNPILSRVQGWISAFRNRPILLVGSFIVGVFIIMAIFGPFIAPFDPNEFHMDARFETPNQTYLLGTDNFGRDVASRTIIGSRSIILLAGPASILGILFGSIVGITSAYYGGWLDEIAMRALDGIMSIPSMLMALLIISTLGTEDINLIIGIGIIYTPGVARVLRSAVLQEKVKAYVAAAQVRGESTAYILFREILPNILSPMIVEASIRFGYAILLSASLGFLGLGKQPPTPDWGLDINKGRPFLLTSPWIVVAPAAAMSMLVIGVSMLGDGIQQSLGISAERRII